MKNPNLVFRRRRQEHGYVLLIAMASLVLLTVTGAMVYRSSENQLMMTVAVKNQNVASMRAAFAAKQVVAELNSGAQPAWLGNFSAQYQTCQLWSSTQTAATTEVEWTGGTPQGLLARRQTSETGGNNGDSLSLDQGGGLQFEAQLVCMHRPGRAGTPGVIIRAIGYYGYDPAGARGANSQVYSDVVEV
ncbi:MAG: hypothetical protein ACT4TC_19675, partial [Myxococcaceae bacterium]